MVTYNILDYSPIDEGSDARKALLQTAELAIGSLSPQFPAQPPKSYDFRFCGCGRNLRGIGVAGKGIGSVVAYRGIFKPPSLLSVR